MKEQIVLRVVSKMVIPYIMVFGFYVITHGEPGPGGGFQGGVILASAFVLYCLIFGVEAGAKVIPQRVLHFLVAVGLLVYAGVGLLGVFGGTAYLDYSVLSADPQAAESLGMTLVENGVGITVAAVMITIFNRLASYSTGKAH